jgi:hypothetical protein
MTSGRGALVRTLEVPPPTRERDLNMHSEMTQPHPSNLLPEMASPTKNRRTA